MEKTTNNSQNSSVKKDNSTEATIQHADLGFQFHKKTDGNDVLIRAASDMGLNITEINEMLMKYKDFFILATSAYLRITLNDKAFAEKTPVSAMYHGRDMVFDMMNDFMNQYNINKKPL